MKCHDGRLNDCAGLPHIVLSTKTSLYRSYAIRRVWSGGGSHTAPNAHTTCVLGPTLIVETRQSSICLSRIIVKFKVSSTNIVCKSDIRLICSPSNFNIRSRAFNTCRSFSHVTRLTSTTFAPEKLTIASKRNVRDDPRKCHKPYHENLYRPWLRDLRPNLIQHAVFVVPIAGVCFGEHRNPF